MVDPMVDPDELRVKGADMTRILEAARRVGRELNREDPFVDDERFAALAAEMPDIHDHIKNCFDDAFVIREEKLVEFGEVSVFRNNQLLTLEGMEGIRFVDVACFAGSRAIRSLVGLGPQLVDLPRNCFRECLCLETLRGCERVRTIGAGCFSGCRDLHTLEGLGPAVRVLPERFFAQTGIKNLRGVERVREIGAGCFANCRDLETLEGLGPDVRVLPKECFARTGIQTLCGIERVREIGALCFAGCRHLETLEGLGPAVRVLPKECFARTGIQTLRGMQHVRVLGPDCFRDCKELASAEGLSLDREFEIARPLRFPRHPHFPNIPERGREKGHAFAGTCRAGGSSILCVHRLTHSRVRRLHQAAPSLPCRARR